MPRPRPSSQIEAPVIGRTLAHYEIVEKLGQGGMGEVYLARDTRLGRDVAIKLMPADLAGDAARRARFEREAQAIAALNHPNVVTIHAVEEAEGLLFLVMERVQGVTLTRKIPPAGLPLKDFFNLALQFCEAVAAAHAVGITHRDLKPENVMVDNSGRVKVLDFGLAKLIDDAFVGSDATVAEQTREGVILGTASYMSPEQAEGKPVDPRSDVFTMGILLYEMLTGQRPFQGDTHMSTLTAVIRDDPRPVFEIRPELPREFARIVRRCLEKHPDRRYESARGVRYELEILREELVSGEYGATTPVATVPGTVGPPSTGSQPSMSSPSAAPLDPMLAASQPSMSSMPPVSQSMPPAPQRSSSRNSIVGVAAILVVAAIAWWQWPGESAGPSMDPGVVDHSEDPPTIVVFPFENLGPPDDEYFAAGITDEITTRLAGVQGLRVLSRTSAMQYDRGGKSLAQVAAGSG
jgi:serine/threonine protein kinase